MFSTNFIIAVILFAVSTSFTPGPNNFLLISSGIQFGLKKTWKHIWGIALGFPIMVFITGLFFTNIATLNETIFSIISFLGMAYLLYLGYQVIFSDIAYEEKSRSKPISFFQAALFQWINPKAIVIALGVSSTYVTLEHSLYSQLFFISFVFFIVGLCSSITWAVLGTIIKKLLNNKQNLKMINIFLGILLIISIIQMFPEKF